jgi:hypothetical protein
VIGIAFLLGSGLCFAVIHAKMTGGNESRPPNNGLQPTGALWQAAMTMALGAPAAEPERYSRQTSEGLSALGRASAQPIASAGEARPRNEPERRSEGGSLEAWRGGCGPQDGDDGFWRECSGHGWRFAG